MFVSVHVYYHSKNTAYTRRTEVKVWRHNFPRKCQHTNVNKTKLLLYINCAKNQTLSLYPYLFLILKNLDAFLERGARTFPWAEKTTSENVMFVMFPRGVNESAVKRRFKSGSPFQSRQFYFITKLRHFFEGAPPRLRGCTVCPGRFHHGTPHIFFCAPKCSVTRFFFAIRQQWPNVRDLGIKLQRSHILSSILNSENVTKTFSGNDITTDFAFTKAEISKML